jgi:hypothetical protein
MIEIETIHRQSSPGQSNTKDNEQTYAFCNRITEENRLLKAFHDLFRRCRRWNSRRRRDEKYVMGSLAIRHQKIFLLTHSSR